MRSRCAVATLLLLTSWFRCSDALGVDDPPNIVLILSDDQAWTDYGFMGHPHVRTPNLDRLAANSLTYTRGYVTAPLCRPSLASILTGLPCHRHGVTGNDPAAGDPTIRNMESRRYPRHKELHDTLYDRLGSQPNFVRLLRAAGYDTLQTGKWWESDPRGFGFSHAMTHGDPSRGARHGDEGLDISRKGIEPVRRFLDAVGEGDDANPFFIWHAPLLPHTPHNPPPEFAANYRDASPSEPVARYWAMCEWFDHTCGELLSELGKRGLRESTVVVYITDNGWIQNPDVPDRFAQRSKTSPYEGGVRTPIMVSLPGQIQPEVDDQTLVSAIDIAPTLLALAGVTPDAPLPGIDLRDRPALRRRNAVYGADFAHDIPDVDSPLAGLESRYVVAGQWKLIDPAGNDRASELYDLTTDPHETDNIAGEHPNVAARLSAKLDEWWGSEQSSNGPQQPHAAASL